jgi:hypothetical protein
MSGTALALFGSYPALPAAIRQHGRQAGYLGIHCIYVQPDDGYRLPPFVDEFTAETGAKITDCVPASGVMGANAQTDGRTPATAVSRETLQNKMGTQDKPAGPQQLVDGLLALWSVPTSWSSSWVEIATLLGGAAAPVIIGDPLATSYYRGAHVADLKPYSDGWHDQYVAFRLPEKLMIITQHQFAIPFGIKVKLGTIVGYRPPEVPPAKSMRFTAASGASANALATLSPDPRGKAGSQYLHVTTGVFAGLYSPVESWTFTAPDEQAAARAAGFAAAKSKALAAVTAIKP